MGQSNSRQPASSVDGGFGFANDGTFGVIPSANDGNNVQMNKFRHPWAVTFHLIFKLSSIFIYLFGSLFVSDFLATFVVLIFLISMDFWVVKNITGRLLVGLRWWNYIDDDGHSHWIFENRSTLQPNNKSGTDSNTTGTSSADVEFILFSSGGQSIQGQPGTNNQQITGSDSTVFWISLFLFTLFWFLSLFSAIFSFNIHWVLLVSIALVLSGSNLHGYIRCRFGTNYNSYGSVISQYVGPKMFNMMLRNAQSSSSSTGPTTTANHQ